ncbi:hypothetical protein D1871_05140 [Nakamurella silvestris]|nr:hypothetical protein D1871_05140 [Nakamurella silvestris]
MAMTEDVGREDNVAQDRFGEVAVIEWSRRRLILTSLVLLLIGVGLAACTGTVGLGSSLSIGTDHGTECVPVGTLEDKADMTFGFDTFSNLSSKDVTITRVDLVNPRNIAVAEVYLVPMLADGRSTAVGVSSVWPPADWQTAGIPGWQLSNYTDLKLPALVDGDPSTFNVLVHLVVEEGEAPAFDAMRVTYTDGEDTYFQDTTTSLVVPRSC